MSLLYLTFRDPVRIPALGEIFTDIVTATSPDGTTSAAAKNAGDTFGDAVADDEIAGVDVVVVR